MDYVGINNVPLTISAGSTENCTTITITNDTIVENDETFYVVMTTTDRRVTIFNNMTRVTILSDPADSELCSYGFHTYSCDSSYM